MSIDATPAARWEPTAKWEQRYREVLDAAAMAFAEKGYLGASQRDIADRLGIRAASLYYYLPSKEAALAAVCELGIKSFIENLRIIIASDETAINKVRLTVENQLAPLRTRPFADYVRVFLRHRHELPEDMRRPIVELSREYQRLVEQIFVQGIASKEFRADLDPQVHAFALLGLCNSVIGARVLPKSTEIDDFIEAYFRLLISGVKRAAGRR